MGFGRAVWKAYGYKSAQSPEIKNLSNLTIEAGSWLLDQVTEPPFSLKSNSELELIQSKKYFMFAEIWHPPNLSLEVNIINTLLLFFSFSFLFLEGLLVVNEAS